MAMKSTTCFGKATGRALSVYTCEREADEAARYVQLRHGHTMHPYACQRCGAWHLAAAERHTPSHPCRSCVGADGRPKYSYRSEADARRRAHHIASERGLALRSYTCPHGDGWHLTKG